MKREILGAGTTSEFITKINSNFGELYGLIKNISFGTSIPNNEEGKNGDIYIQYEQS